jgi:tetratricopeptide (TPR) repeat protein
MELEPTTIQAAVCVLSFVKSVISTRECLARICNKNRMEQVSNQVTLVTFLSSLLVAAFDGVTISSSSGVLLTGKSTSRVSNLKEQLSEDCANLETCQAIEAFYDDLKDLFRKRRAQALIQLGELLQQYYPDIIEHLYDHDATFYDDDCNFVVYWQLAAQEFGSLREYAQSVAAFTRVGSCYMSLGKIEPFVYQQQQPKSSSSTVCEHAENGLKSFMNAARDCERWLAQCASTSSGSSENLDQQRLSILQKKLLNCYYAGICGLVYDVEEAIKAFEQAKQVQKSYDDLCAITHPNKATASTNVGANAAIVESINGYHIQCADVCLHLGHAYLTKGSVRYAVDEAKHCINQLSLPIDIVDPSLGSDNILHKCRDRKRLRLAHDAECPKNFERMSACECMKNIL